MPVSSVAKTQKHELTQDQVYSEIKQNLETHLFSLPPRIQGHYAIRQFRMTGDEKYAQGSLVDLLTIAERQAYYACQLDDKAFIERESKLLTSKLGNGPRAKLRKKAVKAHPEFVLLSDTVLRYASRIDEFGFTGPCHEQAMKTLKQYDMKSAFTDPKMIEAWAAQLVNYVYWQKQLGISDYSKEYKAAFQATYPDSQDVDLSKRQYRNKLYGLTHFVLASSGYYQRYVDLKDYQWILDYFENNIDRILKDATEDIITEVGIVFQITGSADHPVVSRIKQHLVNAYSTEHKMILSPSGRANLATGEHRNVLAMMLFKWPETLHQGPYLAEIKSTEKYLPKLVKPKP